MVSAAFPNLAKDEVLKFLNMQGFNVFTHKLGGSNEQCRLAACTAVDTLVRLAEAHGPTLRVWACGGGADRLVQSAALVRAAWVCALSCIACMVCVC